MGRYCTVCTKLVDTKPITHEPAIRVGEVTAAPGETVEVPVFLDNNPGFWGMLIYIYYDEDITATKSANGTLTASSNLTKGSINADPSKNEGAVRAFTERKVDMDGKRIATFYFESDDLDVNIEGDGKLCSVTFTAPEAEGVYTIGIVAPQGDLYNKDEIDIPYELINGSITVKAAPVCSHDWGEGVVTKAATCTADGVRTYTCSVCTETKTEVIKALGHAWGEGVETTKPGCETEGVMTYTCTRCPETKTEKIAPHGHSFSDEWTIDVQATTTREGSKSHHCIYCDAKKDITVIPIPEYYLGDVNGDGRVNVRDLTLLKQYYSDDRMLEIVFVNSDINNDGRINSQDIKYLTMYTQRGCAYDELLEVHGDY